jgi:hypothetical protein
MQETATSWDIRALLMNFPLFAVPTLIIFLFLLLAPVIKLLRRTGHNPLWCLFAIIPGLNAIAFWIFAFKPWPTDKKS